jgi:hypothetical protein
LAVINPSYSLFKLAYATSAIDLSSQLYGTVSNNSSVLSITTGNNATRLIMQVVDATEVTVYEVGNDSRLLSPSSIAPVENALTASTNYPTGSLILRNGVLCKTIVAVTRGVAWAVGTNIQATTLAAELSLKANA